MNSWHDIQFPGLPAWLSGKGPPIKGVSAGGKKLCLIRTTSGIRAIDARCPHAGGPLEAGFLNEAEEIVCPWHRFSFSPTTGESESGGYFVNCYEVREADGRLKISIPPKKKWWKR